jgi:hypothetical protein
MKKFFIITTSLLLTLGMFSSCEEGLLTIGFDYNVYAGNINIAPTTDVGEFTFEEELSNINLDSVLEANGVDASALKGIYIKSMKFTELNGGNFDAFVSASAVVDADGQDPIELGLKPSIPEGANSFEISGDEVNDQINIEELFGAENMKATATLVTDEPIVDPMTVKFEITFNIEAGK